MFPAWQVQGGHSARRGPRQDGPADGQVKKRISRHFFRKTVNHGFFFLKGDRRRPRGVGRHLPEIGCEKTYIHLNISRRKLHLFEADQEDHRRRRRHSHQPQTAHQLQRIIRQNIFFRVYFQILFFFELVGCTAIGSMSNTQTIREPSCPSSQVVKLVFSL